MEPSTYQRYRYTFILMETSFDGRQIRVDYTTERGDSSGSRGRGRGGYTSGRGQGGYSSRGRGFSNASGDA